MSVASGRILSIVEAETELGIDIINEIPETVLQVEYVEPIVRGTITTLSTASSGDSKHC